MSTTQLSPYLAGENRLADVIAAIQAMATYRSSLITLSSFVSIRNVSVRPWYGVVSIRSDTTLMPRARSRKRSTWHWAQTLPGFHVRPWAPTRLPPLSRPRSTSIHGPWSSEGNSVGGCQRSLVWPV